MSYDNNDAEFILSQMDEVKERVLSSLTKLEIAALFNEYDDFRNQWIQEEFEKNI